MIFESTEKEFSFGEFNSDETRVMHYLVNHQYEDISPAQIAHELEMSVYDVDDALDRLAGNDGLFNVVG